MDFTGLNILKERRRIIQCLKMYSDRWNVLPKYILSLRLRKLFPTLVFLILFIFLLLRIQTYFEHFILTVRYRQISNYVSHCTPVDNQLLHTVTQRNRNHLGWQFDWWSIISIYIQFTKQLNNLFIAVHCVGAYDCITKRLCH